MVYVEEVNSGKAIKKLTKEDAKDLISKKIKILEEVREIQQAQLEAYYDALRIIESIEDDKKCPNIDK